MKEEKKRGRTSSSTKASKVKEDKIKSREMLPSESDSDSDRVKVTKREKGSDSGDSDVEDKSKKGPKTSLITAIFKPKTSRSNSNPPEDKDDSKKSKKKRKDRKDSPKKKKKKKGRGRSDSSSSSDRRPVSPLTSPSPPLRSNSGLSMDSIKARPESTTSGDIPMATDRNRSRSNSSSRSPSPDLNHRSVSSPSPELSRSPIHRRQSISPLLSPSSKKRSLSRSPTYHSRSSSMSRSPSPVVKSESKPMSTLLAPPVVSPMLSPMSDGECSPNKMKGKSKKERDKASKRQKLKPEIGSKGNHHVKEEPTELPENKQDLGTLNQDDTNTLTRSGRSYDHKPSPSNMQDYKTRKESSRSLSEEDNGGSDHTPGIIEPYCQENHMPHPSIEELRDKRYLARLKTISMVLSDPHTTVTMLNSVVDLILETGNFSADHENFQFDICNLDQGTIGKIEAVLELP